MTTTIPIFRIFDIDKALAFYIDWLGFEKMWDHSFEKNTPIYLEVRLRNIRIHLSEHHGDCSPGARMMIEDFEHIQEFHEQILAKNILSTALVWRKHFGTRM